ncbi:MAG TPA: isochorismate synthase [Candidatus Limnocylindrales bacterium]|nr:isochorismate synthase [Candidatus Limnocylindrales bacterium]
MTITRGLSLPTGRTLLDAGLLPEGTADALVVELGALLRRAGPAAALVAASIPIARVDPIAVYRAFAGTDSPPSLWLQPSRTRAFVGAGEALRLDLDGAGRFEAAAATWSALAAQAVVGGSAFPVAKGPVLLGGATFAPGPSSEAVWSGFELGRLVVPRLLVELAGDRAVLTGTVAHDEQHEAAVAEVRALARRLEQPILGITPEGPRARMRVVERIPDRRGWSSSVARSAGAVGRGRIDKVVLARRVDLVADVPLDVPTILRRLEESAAGSTILAFERPGGRTFIAATPERLAETHGRTFHTIALAGTRARGDDGGEDDRLATELLASEKDREEHQVVVAMLRETLRPLATEVRIALRPHVVRLRTVQHLATEVSGTLRDGTNLLALVEALHPTPAVGGWPRELALDLLGEQEHLDRGWYAGPAGWLGLDGDGEFVVAIRSGVVAGTSASLFAGCGIVGDSEPDREWEESELKLRALGAALGRIEG